MAPRDFRLGRAVVGPAHPTYFVADIAANHDGDLGRAKRLVELAAEAGADAAKFQNFRAEEIVSRRGFETLGKQVGHQAKWKKSVVDVYRAASIPFEWTPLLAEHAKAVGIDYFSTPYDFDAVETLDPYVPAFKIGSGDITWVEMLERVASKGKPVLVACGASTADDVRRAMDVLLAKAPHVVLMQCNTNYTGSDENFRHIHLNVLRTFAAAWPDVLLGLSDHTPGHATVLGAVALGARVVEKHFTDDRGREGPDHGFSMDPASWRAMVDRTRELEAALGQGMKRIADNETETVVVQRRCVRLRADGRAGQRLRREDLAVLRPSPEDAVQPYDVHKVVGRRLRRDLPEGSHLTWSDLEPPA
jgi:N-acetylneuraminate synthase